MWENLFFTKCFFFSGEGNDVTEDITDPGKKTTLQTILSNYTKTNFYNADEFGLFYKTLPKKSLHLKDDKCTGSKQSKIRMTGLAAANMQCLSLANRKILDASKILKNYLVVTNARAKTGWIQRFSKIGSESLTINFKRKTGKLHSSLITVQPIQSN